ncbi:Ig-like domain-containing protein [Brevibacillus dissolubilis]|uniref:Ig-like domain-containing protein n=1 Tax=Brevibacillus dissolubilis TaxID=1844116 RepID=UPI0011175914|nr:Ig-like domain-containing protein [Brevibacillus dissolubilis]
MSLQKYKVLPLLIPLIGTYVIPASTSGAISSNSNANMATIKLTGERGEKSWYISDIAFSSTQLPANSTLSIKIDDGGEIPVSDSYSYSEEGRHEAAFIVKDKKDKVIGQASKGFKLDKTKPEAQVQVAGVQGENGWHVSDVEVSVGSTDVTSKLAKVDYAIDSEILRAYQEPERFTAEGEHYVIVESKDNAGNVTEIRQPFSIDKTKPIISDVYLQDEYYWDQEFPILFQTKDSISGVGSVTATINDRPVTNGKSYRFTEPGWHTYRIEVKDKAGLKAVYETKFEVYIPANISFQPENLQLDYGTGMSTNFIELPEPFEPEKIKFATVQTNDKTVHVQDPKYGFVLNPIGDENVNGIREMMVKYERESLINVIVPGNAQTEDKWKPSTVTMFGDWDQYHFKGYDHIHTVNSGYTPPPPDVTPPTVTLNPSDGTTNVSVDVTPTLTFSEPIRLESSEELTDSKVQEIIRFTDEQGQPVEFTANWVKNRYFIQLNPQKQLMGNQRFTIHLDKNSFIDSSSNGIAPIHSSFRTDKHEIVFQPPLPIPVIEVEPDEPIDSGEISFPTTPSTGNPPGGNNPGNPPSKPPGGTNPPPPPSRPGGKLLAVTQAAFITITGATSSATIHTAMDEVLTSLTEAVTTETDDVLTRLGWIDNTIKTVMKAMADKMDQGIVAEADVANRAQSVLSLANQQAFNHLSHDNLNQVDRATTVVSHLLDQVVSKLDQSAMTEDFSAELSNAIQHIVETEGTMKIKNFGTIEDLSGVTKSISAKINLFTRKLGEKADLIEMDKNILVETESTGLTRMNLDADAVNQLSKKGFSLSITDEQGVGISVPNRAIKSLENQNVSFLMEMIPLSSVTASPENEKALKVKLLLDGKSQEKPLKSPFIVTLPVSAKNSSQPMLATYFDENTNAWEYVRSSDKQPVLLLPHNGVVAIPTNRFGLFKVNTPTITKIELPDKSLQLKASSTHQLTVNAILGDGNKVDITDSQWGTTYKISKQKLATIDNHGLLHISDKAKPKDNFIVWVKHADQLVRLPIAVIK